MLKNKDIERIRVLKEHKANPKDIDEINYILDKDDSGIADVLEVELKDSKPLTYEMVTGDKPSNFWKSVRATLAGETTVGVIGAQLKNVVKHFVPFGHRIDAVTDNVGDSLKSKQTNQPMLKKILSIKNFINLKDENGNFSWQELGASVLQIALTGAVAWGAVKLGIFNQLVELLN